MDPACDHLLDIGDFVGASGPVIHAAPPTNDDEDRIVFFMTCSLPDIQGYDNDFQTLPWVLFQERDDFDGFTRCVREWVDVKPWDNYDKKKRTRRGLNMSEEVMKLCFGEPNEAKCMF
jgi:hypothetical protein